MNRLLSISVMALILSSPAAAQDVIRVYVFTPTATSAFVDAAGKQLTEAKKNLIEYLNSKKKSTIAIVETAAAADVQLELLSVEAASGAVETKANVLKPGVTSTPRKEFRATGKLSVGEYSTELTAQGIYPAIATAKVGDALDQWIKDNRAQVLAARK